MAPVGCRKELHRHFVPENWSTYEVVLPALHNPGPHAVRVYPSAPEDRRLQSSIARISLNVCAHSEQGILKIFYAGLHDDAEGDRGSYFFHLATSWGERITFVHGVLLPISFC
jgi:hypothetical protein